MTYKNIETATTKSAFGTISLSNIVSGRFQHKELGHIRFRVNDIFVEQLLSVIGGRGDYETWVLSCIRNRKRSLLFDRLMYSSARGWEFCPDEEDNADIHTLRQTLKKLG